MLLDSDKVQELSDSWREHDSRREFPEWWTGSTIFYKRPLEPDVVEILHPEGYRSEEQLKAEAISVQRLMTHLPKNPFCSHCQRAKMENVRVFRGLGAGGHDCEKFGDIVTVDTMVLRGLRGRGINGESDAIVFFDLATEYIDTMPVFSRSVPNTVEAFHKYAGPDPKIRVIYSDHPEYELLKRFNRVIGLYGAYRNYTIYWLNQ